MRKDYGERGNEAALSWRIQYFREQIAAAEKTGDARLLKCAQECLDRALAEQQGNGEAS
jgi:hypothetical protein